MVLNSSEIRANLIEKGRKRKGYFTRDTMVDKTIETYTAAHQATLVDRQKLPAHVIAQIKELVRKEGAGFFWQTD